MSAANIHYVCTRDEARELIGQRDRFWVSNCGCRESRGTCARSRHDVCIAFEPLDASGGGDTKEISRADFEGILREAEARHLVMRPFRDEARLRVDGFCVCCDDCCAYFLDPETNVCDKGAFIERTDRSLCNDCGDCAAVCYFGARKMDDGGLAVDRESCYGCGLCRDVCPSDCITLVAREAL